MRLLETTLERIGNDEYARTNKSFGLTTLRSRHVQISGARAVFDFRGKHGIQRHLDIADRRLAKIVARCRDLPGQALFQYIDADGARHGIGSDDVNAYLRAVSGADITAKDFRTWAATNLAALALSALEAFDTQAKAKKNVVQAGRGGGATPRQHAGDLPEVLHPPGYLRRLSGRVACGRPEGACRRRCSP